MKITKVMRYQHGDANHERDYGQVDIFFDDRLIVSYGDDYHDKGRIRADEFASGALWMFGHLQPDGFMNYEQQSVADLPNWDDDLYEEDDGNAL